MEIKFCNKCGSNLNEDGSCPLCDMIVLYDDNEISQVENGTQEFVPEGVEQSASPTQPEVMMPTGTVPTQTGAVINPNGPAPNQIGPTPNPVGPAPNPISTPPNYVNPNDYTQNFGGQMPVGQDMGNGYQQDSQMPNPVKAKKRDNALINIMRLVSAALIVLFFVPIMGFNIDSVTEGISNFLDSPVDIKLGTFEFSLWSMATGQKITVLGKTETIDPIYPLLVALILPIIIFGIWVFVDKIKVPRKAISAISLAASLIDLGFLLYVRLGITEAVSQNGMDMFMTYYFTMYLSIILAVFAAVVSLSLLMEKSIFIRRVE